VADDAIQSIRDNKQSAPLEALIRSPIAGTVVERLVTPGELLAAGSTPVFTVADLSTMWVSANVFENDLASLARGQRATITADASPRPIVGTVEYIAALVDTASKATAVRIVVPNSGEILKRDMYVRVAIQGHRTKQGMLVSTMAVLRDEDNLPFVILAQKDGSFIRRRVTLGSQMSDTYEIVDGLAVGDHVVTEGALFLQFAESQ
jgi:cobalt-zinc-cadmium efflux system membrane fusion protein